MTEILIFEHVDLTEFFYLVYLCIIQYFIFVVPCIVILG